MVHFLHITAVYERNLANLPKNEACIVVTLVNDMK